MSTPPDRRNNFDLLRLLAALQVVYGHVKVHLGLAVPAWWEPADRLIEYFRGVPIFFVLSGYLISQSWERSGSLASYAANRGLRIYPALWVAFGATVLLLFGFGAFPPGFVGSGTFGAWVVAQVTFAQVWTPAALRDFGVGAVNGSLWSIPVELGFYILLPILSFLVLQRLSRRGGSVVLGLLVLGAALLRWWLRTAPEGLRESLPLKMLAVTPLPWLHFFLIGMLLARHQDFVRRWLHGRGLLFFVLYAGVMALHELGLGERGGVDGTTLWLTFPEELLLAAFAISAAFTRPGIGDRILKGNDVSYGLYVYHMLVVNAFIELGLVGSVGHAVGATVLALGFAWLSWRFVERPALRLKRRFSVPRTVVAPSP